MSEVTSRQRMLFVIMSFLVICLVTVSTCLYMKEMSFIRPEGVKKVYIGDKIGPERIMFFYMVNINQECSFVYEGVHHWFSLGDIVNLGSLTFKITDHNMDRGFVVVEFLGGEK